MHFPLIYVWLVGQVGSAIHDWFIAVEPDGQLETQVSNNL